jgi:FkbM family methyltransferase
MTKSYEVAKWVIPVVIVVLAVTLVVLFCLHHLYANFSPTHPPKRIQYRKLKLPNIYPHFKKEFRSRLHHERRTHSLLCTLVATLPPNTCVLDAGCHVGDTAVKLASCVSDGVTIVAMDPSREKIDFLNKLKQMNGIKSIETVHGGLSDQQMSARLQKSSPNSGAWTLGLEGDGGKNDLMVYTADSLFLRDRVISLVHLDIEGFEYRALRGMEIILKRDRPMVMVEIKHGTNSKMIRPYLEELGYEQVWEAEYNHLFMFKCTYHLIVVCTKNYERMGIHGVNSLYEYAKRHGYRFTLHREHLTTEGLHPNFTKNQAILNIVDAKSDFLVTVDADVEIMDMGMTLGKLLWCTGTCRERTAMRTPEDRFAFSWQRGTLINAGFIVWSNTARTREINRKWMDLARNECRLWAQKHPYQQNVYMNGLRYHLAPMEVMKLDYRQVGMLYSSFIRQTKKNEGKGTHMLEHPTLDSIIDL